MEGRPGLEVLYKVANLELRRGLLRRDRKVAKQELGFEKNENNGGGRSGGIRGEDFVNKGARIRTRGGESRGFEPDSCSSGTLVGGGG